MNGSYKALEHVSPQEVVYLLTGRPHSVVERKRLNTVEKLDDFIEKLSSLLSSGCLLFAHLETDDCDSSPFAVLKSIQTNDG